MSTLPSAAAAMASGRACVRSTDTGIVTAPARSAAAVVGRRRGLSTTTASAPAAWASSNAVHHSPLTGNHHHSTLHGLDRDGSRGKSSDGAPVPVGLRRNRNGPGHDGSPAVMAAKAASATSIG
ncbi:hypothetical protein AAHB33_02310 [Paenarthrobacter sp. S56]|uniref:hypothetical protein n=1 Tax=Paenarthrobacter sp. S56 TaxID=3138179 RepID=UPI00321B34EE